MMVTFHTHHFGALTPQRGEEESIPLLTDYLRRKPKFMCKLHDLLPVDHELIPPPIPRAPKDASA